MDFPLDLNIERSDSIDNNRDKNDNNSHCSTLQGQQDVNNLLNDAINEQYNQDEHCQFENDSQPLNVTHMTTVDYLKRHPCTYRGCNKVFYSRTSLIHHKQSHAIDKPNMGI